MTTERQAVVSINFKPGNTVKVAEEIRNELAKPPSGGWFPGLEDRLKAAQTRFSEIGKHARVIPAFSAAPRPAMKFGDGETMGMTEAAVARHQLMAKAAAARQALQLQPTEPFGENSTLATQTEPQYQAPTQPQYQAPQYQAPTQPQYQAPQPTNQFGPSDDGYRLGIYENMRTPTFLDRREQEEFKRSFASLSSTAQQLAIAFDRLNLSVNKKTLNDYKREREDEVDPDKNPKEPKKPSWMNFLERTTFNPLGGVGGMIGMLGIGGAVAAASPDAINTLTGSFKLLSGQIGTFFIPAVARVSGMLQRASDVVESIPIGVREFVGTAAVAGTALTMFTFAVNKASVSLASMNLVGSSSFLSVLAGGIRSALPFLFAGYLAFEGGRQTGRSNWAPGRNVVGHTIGRAVSYGTTGAVIGGGIGAAIGSVVPGAGTAAGAKIGASAGGFIASMWGAGKGYEESGAPPKDNKIKLANSFQPEFIANPTAFYDKILMQAVKGDQLSKSIEELQEQGNEYLRQSTGYLSQLAANKNEENAARRIAFLEPA